MIFEEDMTTIPYKQNRSTPSVALFMASDLLTKLQLLKAAIFGRKKNFTSDFAADDFAPN